MSQEQYIELFYYKLLNDDKIQFRYDENDNSPTRAERGSSRAIIEFNCSCRELRIIPQEFINTKLKYVEVFKCGANSLIDLDISKLIYLINLECSSNSLLSLDLTTCTRLKYLDCDYNYIENLDLTNNIQLESLFCSGNLLYNIDLTKNRKLIKLYCCQNQFIVPDLTNNNKLRELYIGVSDRDLEYWQPIWQFIEKRIEPLKRKYVDKWKSIITQRKSTLIYKCFKNIKKHDVKIEKINVPIELYDDYMHYII
jgi:hypothetical protein